MKSLKLIVSAAVALVALAVLTPAAWADVGTIDMGISTTITNKTTNVTATVTGTAVSIDNKDNAGLVFRGQGTGAGTETCTFTFARSADNSDFETQDKFTWAVVQNGSTEVIAYTNLPPSLVSSVGYLKCVRAAFTGASTTENLTNCYLKVVKKRLQ